MSDATPASARGGARAGNWTVETVAGRGLPLRGDDLDTDRIIPARFLRCVTFDGIEAHVFEDDRRASALAAAAAAGGRAQGHPFDDPRFRGASVLIVNRNFGCGSSREHAPQALMRWGIRGLVGESFAEIFFGNCVALGIPCLTLPAARVAAVQRAVEEDPGLEITLDLRARAVAVRQAGAAEPLVHAAAMPEGARESFLKGIWDATLLLCQHPEATAAVSKKLPYMRSFA